MNGIYVVNKPEGYTSRDVVNIVGRFLGTRKLGHGGTLDPMATGVLVIAVGTARKALEFITDDTKEYVATVKLGIETDTLDITGNVVKEKENYFLDKAKLSSVLKSFVGKYNQEVPLYSSVRVGGKRLYKYARENIEVELPKRKVEIKNLELIECNHEEFVIKTIVSKGTYIRSLIRDIGDKIKIPCTMKKLVRTRQGDLTINDAVTLEEIETKKVRPLSVEKALYPIEFITVDDFIAGKIMNGAILNNMYDMDIIGFKNNKGDVLALYKPYEKDKAKIKPIKVFKEE